MLNCDPSLSLPLAGAEQRRGAMRVDEDGANSTAVASSSRKRKAQSELGDEEEDEEDSQDDQENDEDEEEDTVPEAS